MPLFNIEKYDYDCTKKCKFREHGDTITSAITKMSISDQNLACFIAKSCRNFAQIFDSFGRSALHMASSTGRYAIVEWLLNNGAIAIINAKDKESGSTALHRAIYYGNIDCAVLLLRFGANFESLDNDCLNPLQYIPRISDGVLRHTELLVWGTNKNYNLGIGNQEVADNPQYIDYFRKNNISIKLMAISSHHSLFLDTHYNLYSVGCGKGGQLGIGSESSLPSPRKVLIPDIREEEFIKDISCSKNHSLILTNKGRVFSCGINKNYQLGIITKSDKLTEFKEIRSLNRVEINKIIAKDQHSVAVADYEVYAWGKNNGQFSSTIKINLNFPEKVKNFYNILS